MRLFEVIFWGPQGKVVEGDEDTIYLVRAPDFHAAVQEVVSNASASDHGGKRHPLAHRVHEIGTDSSICPVDSPRILRGPYYQCAYNHGWRAWNRRIEGSDYTKEWDEELPHAEPGASPNGGPTKPPGNSGVSGGPPSVS